MKRIAGLIGVVAAVAALLLSSCKKDETGTFVLDKSAVYLVQGQSVTVTFTSSNIGSYSVTATPEGWDDPVIDVPAHTITVTAPSEIEDDTELTGTITFSGKVNGGSTVTATLFVGMVGTEDLTSKAANSYLINKKDTRYLIDGMVRGDGSALQTASVDIIWQSKSSLIQYLDFEDGKVSFYVAADDDTTDIKLGNALLGAYDANGELLWSWHLWVADYDPDAEGGTVAYNGYTMMTRNLGALAADNSSTDDILASFGLFYQWGRKDPFIGASTYQASNGSSAAMYNASGTRVYMAVEASSAETGTEEYAAQNPLTYIESPDLHHRRCGVRVRLAVGFALRRSVVGRRQDAAGSVSVRLARCSGCRLCGAGDRGNARRRGCREIRLDPRKGWCRIALFRGRTPPLQRLQGAEHLYSADGPRTGRPDDTGRRRAALGGPLLDGGGVVVRGCGLPFLVREEHLDRRRPAQGTVRARQRHVAAVCAGRLTPSPQDRRYIRMKGGSAHLRRSVSVFLRRCPVRFR